MSNKLEAILTMDSKGFSAACTKAGAEIKTMEASGSRIGTAFKAAGIVAAAGIGVVAFGLWECVKAAEEAAVITAEVNAIIATTGGVANVTGKEIEALGTAIQNKTGYDHDQVRSAAAMLLTFPKVRNEVGASNDIFTRALDLSTDLARKFGMDLPAAAKMLGKALGEPVAGATALRRQGVMLTDQQKEQIKVFVESGDILSAQKIILGEVATEVGLVAESYGQTLPGKIDILKGKFGEMKEIVGNALLPVLTDMITKMSSWNWDKIGQGIAGFIKGLGAIPSAIRIIAADVEQVFAQMELAVINGINAMADIAEHVPGPLGKWGTDLKRDTQLSADAMKRNIILLQLDKDVVTGVWDSANYAVKMSMADMGSAAVAKMGQTMTALGMTIAQGKPGMAMAMSDNMTGLITALASGMPGAQKNMKGLVSELEKTISSAQFYSATTDEMNQMAAAISQNTGVPISTVLALMNTLRGSVNNADFKGAINNAMAPLPGQILSFKLPSFQSALAVAGAVGQAFTNNPAHPVVGGLLFPNGSPTAAAMQVRNAIQSAFSSSPVHIVIGAPISLFSPAIQHTSGAAAGEYMASVVSGAMQAGFDKNMAHPVISGAGMAPALSMNTQFPMGAGVTNTHSTANTVTIHVSGAGNPVSVAQEVRKVFDDVTAGATHLQRVLS